MIKSNLHTLPTRSMNIEHFAAWLRSQPNDRKYSMGSIYENVLAHYLRDYRKDGARSNFALYRGQYYSVGRDEVETLMGEWAEPYMTKLFGASGRSYGTAKRLFYNLHPEYRIYPIWMFWKV